MKKAPNKDTFNIIRGLMAKNLRLAGSTSFGLPNYEELDEMQVNENLKKGMSIVEFQNLRKEKQKKNVEVHLETKYIIRYSSNLRLYWDMWIIALAVWNALNIPVDIAYEPDISSHPFMIILNALIDFNFFIDIILTFRTTYYDKEGEEIFDWRKIAKKYLAGKFTVDLISTIPLDLSGISFLQTFQLLKLLRLSRISKIIKNLPLKEDVKASIKVLNLIFMLFIYIHCMA
jgi:hypothetical protein